MTVIAKTVTYGIESKIKLIQQDLNNELLIANEGNWNGTVNIYGKIQPVLRKGEIEPEVWLASEEYSKGIFINDKIAGSVGFHITDEDNTDFNQVATIDIIFSVILTKIYTNDDTVRQDERALIEAKRAIENCAYINEVTNIKRGVKDVFADFTTEKIKYRDMQPWFVFSFTCDVTYSNDFCQGSEAL